MHRILLPLFPLALSCPLAGQPLTSDTDRPCEVEEDSSATPDISPYLHWHQKFKGTMQAMAALLEQVNDQETATAAAPEFTRIRQELVSLLHEEKELPQPSGAIQEAYARHIQAQGNDDAALAERTWGKILELMLEQNPPCYGSADLQDAIRELMEFVITYK